MGSTPLDPITFAPVVKLAYTMDLGSISERSAGSSPVRCTQFIRHTHPLMVGAYAFSLRYEHFLSKIPVIII